jgi:hypothetical protein
MAKNIYSLLICIAVAIPFFDVVYTASGVCPASKLAAVNACTLAGKYSLEPEVQCNLKYGETRQGGNRGYNSTDPWTICICQGYTIVGNVSL